jgi:hypothetical protein
VYVICLVVAALSKLTKEDCEKYDPADFVKKFKTFKEKMIAIANPCGRYHTSPYVRDYIDNVCQIAGINWNSSIFKNPASLYYNTVYFNAPLSKGKYAGAPSPDFIEDNAPLITGIELLDQLKEVYNANYYIINGVLVFERKDYFNMPSVWIDTLDISNSKREVSLCYNWDVDTIYTGAKIEYSDDALDTVSNEGKYTRYSDIIDWTTGFTTPSMQKDFLKRVFPFAPVRVFGDGINFNIFDDMEVGIFQVFGNQLNYEGCIIMEKDVSTIPKLIILQGGGNPLGKPVVQNISPQQMWKQFTEANNTIPVLTTRIYNYPMWVNDEYNSTIGANIYEFHKIDDPRSNKILKYNYTLEFKYNCVDLQEILSDNGFMKKVILHKGDTTTEGTIDEVIINFSQGTMKVTGKAI